MTTLAPALRVVLPCDDENEFRRRLAGPIAENGLFVPNARERPAGSTLRLRLELRDGSVVSGEALVVGAGSAERPGVLVRFLRLDPESIQLDLTLPPGERPTPAGGEAPRPATALQSALFGDVRDLPPPTVSKPLELRVKPVTLRVEGSGAPETAADPSDAATQPAGSTMRSRARRRRLVLAAIAVAAIATAAGYAALRWKDAERSAARPAGAARAQGPGQGTTTASRARR